MATKKAKRAKEAAPRGATLVELFGKHMRDRRVELKLSQQALAERAKLSISYVSMLERAQRDPPLSTCETLARALECAPTYLLA